MKRISLFLLTLICLLPIRFARAENDPLFFFFDPFVDPLSPRDEYGLFHQTPNVNRTDLEPRHSYRFQYYFESSEKLAGDPAYVGVLQRSLYNYGYYCGPIDGVFSPRVSEAIAHLQKNYSLRVTGTLTDGVRRALHLP